MARAVLITGSNLGPREDNLAFARKELGTKAGMIIAHSAVMESEPWGDFETGSEENIPKFLNQILVVETQLGPYPLLYAMQRIEEERGRIRNGAGMVRPGQRRYRSRVLDIDMLFYDDLIIDSDTLTVPHPRMGEREFVLKPLAEVITDYVHPVSGKTVAEMLSELTDIK